MVAIGACGVFYSDTVNSGFQYIIFFTYCIDTKYKYENLFCIVGGELGEYVTCASIYGMFILLFYT